MQQSVVEAEVAENEAALQQTASEVAAEGRLSLEIRKLIRIVQK